MNPFKSYCIGLALIVSFYSIFAQSGGAIKGRVSDKESNSELPGATIQVEGTVIGATSDIYGNYYLPLDEGTHQIEVRYLGFMTQKKEITIQGGQTVTLDFSLEADISLMEEVVITAQLLGQQAAINQQIKANSIVNVVSKDRIQSLPDQNAAESVGRLPGISIRRNGGEGQQVVVRGLSPRFNAITLNGVRIPSSEGSDRSFDLSTLSTDALQGIEVFKSWTPNLDGDAIGGTVNFITKKADEGLNGRIRYLHGYNGQQEEFGQHRVNAEIGSRFFNNKIGIIASGNFQRADRSQDRFDADFFQEVGDDNNQGNEELGFENINLEDRLETRDRFGGTVSLDYTFDKGDIRLFSNYSQTNRDQVRRRRRYRRESGRQEYEFLANQSENRLIANTLSGTYNITNKLVANWSSSYSLTRIRTPFNNSLRFRENSAYDVLPVDPTAQEIIDGAQNQLDLTFLQRAQSDEDNIDFSRITGQLDLSYPINLGKWIGKLRAGGKVRLDDRERDLRRFQARADVLEEIGADNSDRFTTAGDQILMENFLGDFVAADFLEGDFFMGPGSGRVNGGHLDASLANDFLASYQNLYERDLFVDSRDYLAKENIYAYYMMTDFKVGSKLTVLAGVRNETTTLDYTGFQVSGSASSAEIDIGDDPRVILNDSIVNRSYTEWLPSLNLKYQISKSMDIRAAVTKTLSRPSFLNLVPFTVINFDQQEIQRGNFNLRHQVATNYDLFLSFYNKIGLFTIGGFYKQIEDADFIERTRVTPITQGVPAAFNGFDLLQPSNARSTSEVKGIELDFQANLASLPSPWNGVTFSANATFIRSTTFFPRVFIASNPPRPVVAEREGSFAGQPNETYNITFGYEKGGFSGRLSIIHQADSFGFPNEGDNLGGLEADLDRDPQLDGFTGRTTRLDFSMTQKVMKNIMLFFNANNITNQEETEFNGNGDVTSTQFFGATYDLGLQYKF